MKKKKTIIILNKFLDIQNEILEDYETNILETKDKDLKNLLYKFQKKCFESKAELKSEIMNLGGEPIEASINSKKFLHLWLDFKNVFIPTNREDLLHICEYNEYLNIKKFKSLMQVNSHYLNSSQTQIINKQLDLLQKNHDYFKILSEQLIQENKKHHKKNPHEVLQTL